MRVLYLLLILFICQCWAGSRTTESSKRPRVAQNTVKSTNFSAQLPFNCNYYGSRTCNPGDFFCSNIPPKGSCSCTLSPPYVVVESKSTSTASPKTTQKTTKASTARPSVQCSAKSWRTTPRWILFFALIGFLVFSCFFLFFGYRLWPTVRRQATDAYDSARNFILGRGPSDPSSLRMSALYSPYDENGDSEELVKEPTSSRY